MADNNDNDKTRIVRPADHDDETVFSATELEKHNTRADEPDNDRTQQINTGMQQDEEATMPMSSSAATVLAGGTEAVQQIISTSNSPRVAIGSLINHRFQLEKLLGRGGMGEVYLATDRRKLEAQDKSPYVAIKVLGENFKRHPQAFVALQREARKTQDLAHPNIVTVYDFDRQGDTAYLTMEALQGKPMDEEIRSETRPIEEACRMIIQCARGLAYAHEKGLVHSDLKPGNLFLTDDGNVKLLDFGIARAFHSGKDIDQQQSKHADTIFDAGELGALTPAYATVEMIEGKQPHSTDDVYAMGLIAYELLTGKHPFDKKMATQAEKEGLRPEPIKGLNKRQWHALESALAFRREDRIQDAQEFLDKFTAKSKTPLYLTASFIILAFIAVASINILFEPEKGPSTPFSELPAEQQQKITRLLEEAEMVTGFGDVNSALMLLNQAFLLHPYNRDVMKQLEQLVTDLLKEFQSLDKQAQLRQIGILQQYESLKDNRRLAERKRQLQP